jgi:hypothetical protein
MWYLVKIPCWNAPYWVKSSKTYWLNVNEGRTPKSEKDVIFETAEGDYSDLDHTKTGLVVKHSDAGWLSPDGRWFPCRFHEHRLYATLILKMEYTDLKDRGWVSVEGKRLGWFCEKLLMEAQRAWLIKKGYEVHEWE